MNTGQYDPLIRTKNLAGEGPIAARPPSDKGNIDRGLNDMFETMERINRIAQELEERTRWCCRPDNMVSPTDKAIPQPIPIRSPAAETLADLTCRAKQIEYILNSIVTRIDHTISV